MINNKTTQSYDEQLSFTQGNSGVRVGLAKNPFLLPEIQTILFQDKYTNVLRELAANPCLSYQFQFEFSFHKNKSIRIYLTRNPNLDSAIAAKLTQDTEQAVRNNLALNTKYLEIQKNLIKNQNEEVYLHLARNKFLFSEIQLFLSNLQSDACLLKLASNPKLEPQFQSKILDGIYSRSIKDNVIKNVALTKELQINIAQDFENSNRFVLLENNNVYPEVLELIALQEKNYYQLGCLASYRKIHIAAQMLLIEKIQELKENRRGDYNSIIFRLFANPNLCLEALRKIFLDCYQMYFQYSKQLPKYNDPLVSQEISKLLLLI